MPQLIEFATKHWDLFLALIIILAMLYGGPIGRRIRGYKETDASGAVRLMNHMDAVLIDVREPKEYQEGHVAEAHHIPLSNFDKEVDTLEKFRQKPMIVVCRSGHRSAIACGRLRKQGFETVYNLKGGMLAWQDAGLPLSKAGKKKNRK